MHAAGHLVSINAHDNDSTIACREKVNAIRYAFEVCSLCVDGWHITPWWMLLCGQLKKQIR